MSRSNAVPFSMSLLCIVGLAPLRCNANGEAEAGQATFWLKIVYLYQDEEKKLGLMK
jgi:hypothetical protein